MTKDFPRLGLLALVALVGAIAIVPDGAGAQEYLDDFMFHPPKATISFNLGYSIPNAGSDLFDEVTTVYTMSKGDFRAPLIGGGLSFFMNERLDLAFELAFSRASTWAEYVEYVGADDLPIEHETTFTQVPVTASLKYFFKDRGREIGTLSWIPTSWAPYIGGGVGTMYYQFEQSGEFINFAFPDELPIYRDTVSSSGWAWVAQAFGGVQWSLSPQVVVSGEVRYSLAKKDLERGTSGFTGYDPIDLSGLRGSVGFGLRF